ncbi:MAG: VWA domain-containing protein [Hyphomicrobium sp.]|nr:VWA domain-containing protein [Hyphomicrobium sp.]
MNVLEFEPWEPEESVGKLWHSFVSKLESPGHFGDVAATLEETRGRLGILFRGLGGARDVELKAASAEESQHRMSWRRSLGQSNERLELPSFDGEVLRLPHRIAVFDEHAANVALYIWLAASTVFGRQPRQDDDPLRADIRVLQAVQSTTRATLAACPGLRSIHATLVTRTRVARLARRLPACEAAVEAAILHMLGAAPPIDELAIAIAAAVRSETADLSAFRAPSGYKPFMPVLLWPQISGTEARAKAERDDDGPAQGTPPPLDEDQRTLRAARKKADQAARKDSLVLYKFESILSWAEFLNVNRRIDDDDQDSAKKAADDLNEINLARVPQKARARLRLHLDLSPQDAEFERLAGVHVYPEWDHRTKSYLPDYCRVLAGAPAFASDSPTPDLSASVTCEKTRRRIRSVRRQFEALRPKRVHLSRQVDGDEIDFEAAVNARVELAATGEHSDRVYRSSRNQDRDLAVSILLDASRSTESIVGGRQVIDIEREALMALAWGLHACGDETAINAFSSLRRDRVFIQNCKTFAEPMGASVEARIASVRPGHYTRLGTAVRHVSSELAKRSRQRRLLLVITDGKPNDLDHYEGRHGIEDTHMAVREARRQGQSVFGITIDSKSQATFTRIFGSGGFVVIPDPEKLAAALPQLYAHLVGG